MYFATPCSKQSSEDDSVSALPPDSLGLLGASAGSSTLAATSGYGQLYAEPFSEGNDSELVLPPDNLELLGTSESAGGPTLGTTFEHHQLYAGLFSVDDLVSVPPSDNLGLLGASAGSPTLGTDQLYAGPFSQENLASVLPPENLGPLGTSAGSSTFGTDHLLYAGPFSEGDLGSVPLSDNPGLLGALASSSTLGATSEYDQLYDGPFGIPSQMELDTNSPTYETQNHGTGGDSNIQSTTATEEPALGRRPRAICVHCNMDFIRASERNRHVRETHGLQHRPRCPFCNFTCARIYTIKAHAMANHAERFTAEKLDQLAALRGQQAIEFLRVHGYGHGPDMEATL